MAKLFEIIFVFTLSTCNARNNGEAVRESDFQVEMNTTDDRKIEPAPLIGCSLACTKPKDSWPSICPNLLEEVALLLRPEQYFKNRMYHSNVLNFEFQWYIPAASHKNSTDITCSVVDLRNKDFLSECRDCFDIYGPHKAYSDGGKEKWNSYITKCGRCFKTEVDKHHYCQVHFPLMSISGPGSTEIYLKMSNSEGNQSRKFDATISHTMKSASILGQAKIQTCSISSKEELERSCVPKKDEKSKPDLHDLGIVCRLQTDALYQLNMHHDINNNFSNAPLALPYGLAFMANRTIKSIELEFQTVYSTVTAEYGNCGTTKSTAFNTTFSVNMECSFENGNTALGFLMQFNTTVMLQQLYWSMMFGTVVRDASQYGMINLSDSSLINSNHYSHPSILGTIGCFSWIHNKWYVILNSRNEDLQIGDIFISRTEIGENVYLAYHEGSPPNEIQEKIMGMEWTVLTKLNSNETYAAIKCAQLGNVIMWSSFAKDGKEIVIHSADLHEDNGTLILQKHFNLDQEELCSCNNNTTSRMLSSAAFDLFYANASDAQSLTLAAICGSAICISTSALKHQGLLQSQNHWSSEFLQLYNETIIWFQLDQDHLYFANNRNKAIGFVRKAEPNHFEMFVNISSAARLVEAYSRVVLTLQNTSVELVSSETPLTSFNLYKDVQRMPIPPYDCLHPSLTLEDIQFTMINNSAGQLKIRKTWNRPDFCISFARPRLKWMIKFSVHKNMKLKAAAECKSFSCLKSIEILSHSSAEINESRIIVVTASKLYHFEISVLLRDIPVQLHQLWFPESEKPLKVEFRTDLGTDPLVLVKAVIGLGCLLFILLLVYMGYHQYSRKKRLKQLLRKVVLIQEKDIVISEQLGNGKFGIVCKATWNNDADSSAIVVAVKKLILTSREDEDAIFEEANICSRLKDNPNENILQIMGICLKHENKPAMLVFEYLNGGSLDVYLQNEQQQELISAKDLLKLVKDALKACIHLESLGVIHRDIAARNCLVAITDNIGNPKLGQLKLGDFGLAKDIGTKPGACYQSKHAECIPINSSAPESLEIPSTADHKSDIGSFGVLIYEMFSWGSIPFGNCILPQEKHSEPCKIDHISNNLLIRKIGSGYTLLDHIPCVANFNVNLKDIMRACWKFYPKDRPSFCLLKDLLKEKRESIQAICLTPLSRFRTQCPAPTKKYQIKPLPHAYQEESEDELSLEESMNKPLVKTLVGYKTDDTWKFKGGETLEEFEPCGKNSDMSQQHADNFGSVETWM